MKKKLIEVALPLDAINKASAREKSIRHGHPSTLHLWWARRPLATARAVIFAQMVDDPSAHPDLFPTERKQEKERQRLFRIIEELVTWENTTNEEVLQRARDEIWTSWRRTCAENADHPRAKELFDRDKLPAFHDPFAGGGALPLEAQRLGLESYASDLNPVAVLINKAMIEIPPKFAGKPPVNPVTRKDKSLFDRQWKGAQGLAEDVRYYGQWMRDEAEKRIGNLYPKVEVTREMAKSRPDLKIYVGRKLRVMAWLWARTVKSPNPAFAKVDVPLASTFMLSTKKGKEAYVEPVLEDSSYRFTVKVGKPKDSERAKRGTKVGRGGNFQCLMSGTPIPVAAIRAQGLAGTLGARLMAIVAEGDKGRVYFAPTEEHEAAAKAARPTWAPEQEINYNPRDIRTQLYGLTTYGDLFTPRQLVALTTFSDLVKEVRERVKHDAGAAGLPDDGKGLDGGGAGARVYGEALGVYLAFLLNQVANHSSSGCGWNNANTQMRSVFARQAIPMVWDYAECNPFCSSSGSYNNLLERQVKGFVALGNGLKGTASQADASDQSLTAGKLVSTDPPYYDNIGYADLSDFFYVWLRRTTKTVFPDLFSTLTVPKAAELVATPYRHSGREKAESFFLGGMTDAMHRLAEQAHPAFPVTIYYAFKQSERKGSDGVSSTGWETFLDAVLCAGLAINGTWPMRTEKKGRVTSNDTNALASSIILVCRPRMASASTATRGEFIAALKTELPVALAHLQGVNIAPVDLAQASIGPGMAIFTRYKAVIGANGKSMSVGTALELINETLDEILSEQEADFDADTRFAVAWFDQFGMKQEKFGEADNLARAKVTSVDGLVASDILEASKGEVRLIPRSEYPDNWDPSKDRRTNVWEVTQHLIKALEDGGEDAAASLLSRVGKYAETARELAYRLYQICERKKWAKEAIGYNSIVVAWPEIERLAAQRRKPTQDRLL